MTTYSTGQGRFCVEIVKLGICFRHYEPNLNHACREAHEMLRSLKAASATVSGGKHTYHIENAELYMNRRNRRGKLPIFVNSRV